MSNPSTNPRGMHLRECEVVYRSRSIDVAVRHFRSSEDVHRLLCAIGAAQRVSESVWVILLDARGKLIAVHECARGGVAHVSIDIAEVFRAALVIGANSLILAHNHPSGECEPSREDDAFTQRVYEAADLLGVKLLDHVVVAEGGYYSYIDAGRLHEAAA